MLKIQVANYKFNVKLQFSRTFAELISCAQRNIVSMIYIAYHIYTFRVLLCNVLHIVENMSWVTFLRGLLLLLFPTN